jgi:hypothetical protein
MPPVLSVPPPLTRTGDDEKKAWDNIFEKQANKPDKKDKKGGGGRGGRGRGRGGRGRGGGRGRSNSRGRGGKGKGGGEGGDGGGAEGGAKVVNMSDD